MKAEVKELPNWEKINSAPKDGSRVWVKRFHRRSVVKTGWAVWDKYSEEAPIRHGQYSDMTGPISPNVGYADMVQWLTEDRLHSFPSPTHWSPNLTARQRD